MKLDYISCTNFRNIACETVEFSEGVNLLYGNNAEGKTNLLEAAYILACAKSFRTNKNRELVKNGENTASIGAEFSGGRRTVRLKCEIGTEGSKRIYKNSVKLSRLSEFLGQLRVVLFCPEHLSLIKDGPKDRRSFIDAAICQLKPRYASLLHEYSLILMQRSALLRAIQFKNASRDTLDIWDEKLSLDAAKIIPIRREYISRLSEYAKKEYFEISQKKEEMRVNYISDIPSDIISESEICGYYKKMLENSRESDIKYGYTSHGIGRDDIEISVNGYPAKSYCSQGQQRSAVLALKLAEGKMSAIETGEMPIFLFDDILSELDAKRQSFILSKLKGGQVILTDCDRRRYKSVDVERKIYVRGGIYEIK